MEPADPTLLLLPMPLELLAQPQALPNNQLLPINLEPTEPLSSQDQESEEHHHMLPAELPLMESLEPQESLALLELPPLELLMVLAMELLLEHTEPPQELMEPHQELTELPQETILQQQAEFQQLVEFQETIHQQLVELPMADHQESSILAHLALQESVDQFHPHQEPQELPQEPQELLPELLHIPPTLPITIESE